MTSHKILRAMEVSHELTNIGFDIGFNEILHITADVL